ncbi:DNA dependent ATPase [Metschnikowia bicuspidata var. bicuspidata NRRL YB-4993]|uniref:DNA dependent ATPase n=1 Tax=Metschnikowia bicuspidata var. bicuspidata NRRL YB-4993 TaxID=869754 RepID=A0A1A0HFL6_9ASCO|nr:DNA dependent ATPase [Metschnikowia bicuspidata var. bicuspidata NRRL YB-4993]OBA22687.1 DNA dependent ATPase [Metschnikowia bicuspidata var. bicuspidata NRRL YB-4993]
MASPLPEIGATLVDQDELESSLTKKANDALLAKESELDEKRLQKTAQELGKARKKVAVLERRLADARTRISLRRQLKDEIAWLQEHEVAPLLADVQDIQARLAATRAQLEGGASRATAGETERDFLIRTGRITAFGSASGFLAANEGEGKSLVHLRAPGFGAGGPSATKTETSDDEYVASESGSETSGKDGAGDVSGAESADEGPRVKRRRNTPNEAGTPTPEAGRGGACVAQRNVDDGDEETYQKRLHEWVQTRLRLRAEAESRGDDPGHPEWQRPHPTIPDAVLNADFRLPGDVFPSLFDYQKTCVQWLWELYAQKTGGIIGDEMGLGKTIQVIAFLAGLHYSGRLDKPVLLVVPATVLNQWVNEFHRWWPPLRCVILHSIGAGMTPQLVRTEEQLERHMEQDLAESQAPAHLLQLPHDRLSKRTASNQANAREIVRRVLQNGHVLVTTYVGLRMYLRHILPHEWGYVVLDEGHKIRNPNSEISLTCKRVRTHNRVILSGTPIQNNLVELWSLFDFVFPGRLGTLPVFEQQFAVPINMGGYANASNVQVQTGYQCAVVLRDLISPYLLRRLKADVAQDLPKKNEMVLFVKLTQTQQDMYERFLGSDDVGAILKGRRNVLMGVDLLRKICNHPDLVDRERLLRKPGYRYGAMAKLGKMVVLKNLLQLWQSQGHRTLLFCQTKQMLDILEKFVGALRPLAPGSGADARESGPAADPIDTHFNYLRMDGATPIAKRQQLVDTFNSNTHYHVFLLTTKVGGLGVNLTGADRVIIFDPDWNPSTDLQARERAWRLGQKKDITIYRLMTAGTIEEKIYHRQIFKTFLTNKILKDPKQRRFFKLNDLHDLFSLGDPDERGTETGDMFGSSEKTYGGGRARKLTRLLKKAHANDDDFYRVASIMGVSKLDEFAGEDEANPEDTKNKDDSRIMEGLFSKAGIVHSTLKHDEVMDSSPREVSLIEKEASRVAKEAADALKQSRLIARRKAIGTPTWTGKFGTAGRFGPPKKHALLAKRPSGRAESADPLSSTSILQGFRKGKKKGDAIPHREALLDHIVDFLSRQPDRFSKSNAILQSLPESVDTNNETQMVTVRSLLREAANWDSEAKGWRLKATFEETG